MRAGQRPGSGRARGRDHRLRRDVRLLALQPESRTPERHRLAGRHASQSRTTQSSSSRESKASSLRWSPRCAASLAPMARRTSSSSSRESATTPTSAKTSTPATSSRAWRSRGHPSDVSQQLRDDLQKLVGKRLDTEEADRLKDRLENELRGTRRRPTDLERI